MRQQKLVAEAAERIGEREFQSRRITVNVLGLMRRQEPDVDLRFASRDHDGADSCTSPVPRLRAGSSASNGRTQAVNEPVIYGCF